jgi:hypothetical protein
MATTNAKIRIKRDTRANWTSANPTLDSGQAGFITDERTLKVGDGSTPFATLNGISTKRTIQLSAVSNSPTASLQASAAGVRGAAFVAPFAGVITGWRVIGVPITGQVNGSVQLDVWKKSSGGGLPVAADTITASAKPSLSSALEASSSTLTGWTTTFAAGDKFVPEIETVSNLAEVYLVLEVEAR